MCSQDQACSARRQSKWRFWCADVPSEKRTRGLLRSAVERRLSKRAVLIVDSLNNIKGYRWAALVSALSCWPGLEKRRGPSCLS